MVRKCIWPNDTIKYDTGPFLVVELSVHSQACDGQNRVCSRAQAGGVSASTPGLPTNSAGRTWASHGDSAPRARLVLVAGDGAMHHRSSR